MKTKPLIIVLVIVVLGAIGAFLWFQYGSQREKEIIKIQYPIATGAITELRSYIIKKYGIDKKYGLDLDFVYLNPGDIERKTINRDFLIGDLSPITASELALKGTHLKILHPQFHLTYFIAAKKDSPIQTLEDLKGKKFAVTPKLTAGYVALAYTLKSIGIDPEKEFNIVFGSIPEVVNLLQKGDAEAANIAYPLGAKLIAEGQVRPIVRLDDIVKQKNQNRAFPFVFGVAHEDWLATPANKKIAGNIAHAMFEASKLMRERPEVITEEANAPLNDYLKKNKLDTPAIKKILRESIPGFFYETWSDDDIANVAITLKHAKEFGLLPQNAPENIIVKPADVGF